MLKHFLLFAFINIFIKNAICFSGSYVIENDSAIYENWLRIIVSSQEESIHSEIPVYDIISENFYQLYRRTEETVYLNYSLHEAGRGQREEIISRLNASERDNIGVILKKLTANEVDQDYYQIRSFTPEDIYKFVGTPIPESLKSHVESLLNSWLENLPLVIEQDIFKGALKAQAIVQGFDRIDNFNKVFETGIYLQELNALPPSLFALTIFETISYSARVLGFYQQALQINQNFLQPIAEQIADTRQYLTTRMDYATTLFRIGNLNSALDEFEYIYSQDFMQLESRYQTVLLNNLAISYLNTGQFNRYVQFQLDAFEIAAEEQNYRQQLSILRNLFIYYLRQNEREMAYSYLNQALQLAQNFELSADVASILITFGIYKRDVEENFDEALFHFKEANDLTVQTDNYHHQYNSLIDIAETYIIIDDFSSAEPYFVNAMELSSSREDSRNYLQASIRYANLLTLANRFDEAEELLSAFSERDFVQLNFEIRVLANNVKIRLLKNRNELGRAVELSTPIITEIVNWLRESTDQQTGHMRMDDEFTDAFKLHTRLMYETDQYYRALSAIGELRNISRAGFYNNPLLKSKVLSEQELIDDYNLSVRIQQLRNRYLNANDEQRVYLGNELLTAISERNRLQSRAFPNHSEHQYDQLFSRIRRHLRSDQMVFYFSVFNDEIFRFTLTRSGITMRIFSGDDTYHETLSNGINSLGAGTTDLHKLNDIYTTFFEGSIPRGITHIYMIPDGDFYRLPLEILPVERSNSPSSYGSARYMLEEYSISYANSLTELIEDASSANQTYTYDLAGFGIENFGEAGHPQLPDLPFSPREIEQSSRELQEFPNKAFFIGDQSTEQNFRAIAGNSKILHLATHSKVNNENPLFSTLYLYSNNEPDHTNTEDDGIIHAYELFDMNLNADLIFLSSCESGAGGYLQGTGVLGFSRAFSYAGAKSLSMNLWPVRDQIASEISTNFYRSLNQGENKAEALRQARLHYLNHTNSDPYLWGSFVLFGNIESPLAKRSFFTSAFVPVLSLLIIAGLLLIVLMGGKQLKHLQRVQH